MQLYDSVYQGTKKLFKDTISVDMPQHAINLILILGVSLVINAINNREQVKKVIVEEKKKKDDEDEDNYMDYDEFDEVLRELDEYNVKE
jgi:hypothetical protein